MKWSRFSFSSALVEDFRIMQPVRAINRFGSFRLRAMSFFIEPMTLSSAFCFTEQELKIRSSAVDWLVAFLWPSLFKYVSIRSESE